MSNNGNREYLIHILLDEISALTKITLNFYKDIHFIRILFYDIVNSYVLHILFTNKIVSKILLKLSEKNPETMSVFQEDENKSRVRFYLYIIQ